MILNEPHFQGLDTFWKRTQMLHFMLSNYRLTIYILRNLQCWRTVPLQ